MSETEETDDVFATDLEVAEEDDIYADAPAASADAGAAGAVLEFVARSIVDDADSVRVEVENDRRGVMLRLHVAPDDMGKVIGRRGRVAQAIRTLVRATAAKEGVEANVDIVD